MVPHVEGWVERLAREYATNPCHFQTSLTVDLAEDGVQEKGKAGEMVTHLAAQEACDRELSILYQYGDYRSPITFQDLVNLELGKTSGWMVEEVEAEQKKSAGSPHL